MGGTEGEAVAAQTKRPMDERFRAAGIVYRKWHVDPLFWRDIYTRTLSALTATLVGYIVVVISGNVTAQPLLVVVWLVLGVSTLVLLRNVAIAFPVGRQVLKLLRHWNESQDDKEIRARRIYVPLILSFYTTLLSGLALFLLLLFGIGTT